MTTPTDIVNQSLQYMGDNTPPVTGNAPNFDSSPAGVAASQFYYPVVRTISRQYEWDFARSTVALALSGNTAPDPWQYEYAYPDLAVQIWQVKPETTDPNNPLPTNWIVANALVSGVQKRVIQSDLQNAYAVINNMPNPDAWDDGFREAVVRLLASVMSAAIAGKPDMAQSYLDSAGSFENAAEGRDN